MQNSSIILDRKHAIEIIQEVGETIFVPSGWYHQVENLEDTLSINHNWINGFNIKWSWDRIRRELNRYASSSTRIAAAKEHKTLEMLSDGGLMNGNGNAKKKTADDSKGKSISDDLLLLWLMVSAKAIDIVNTTKEKDSIDQMIRTKDGFSIIDFNLRAILPILEGIQDLIARDEDFGLRSRCECNVDELQQLVKEKIDH
eukprot:CAMPEP_0116004240 /NCGR_PEP_ID=MMETSP0321-20121206/493_1 /TAXON_ID=163516 /ORGANISM="Leptocylindrus danicus var. danicus, Strain B650" /LENGTH=199 /DNA_ID=CAMNT_0003472521 /DNA_START=936 /DNA_END=1535 /DNA_ORIENTATION=-